MDRATFQNWLEKGLGRAVLFLQANDDLPYRDLIVHACTHDQAFDRQLESRTAAYQFDLINATSDPAYYRDRVLASLLAPMEEEDRGQMFEIAELLAKSGDEGARLAMLAAFSQTGNEEIDGAETIIRLDGYAALPFITKHRPALDAEEDDYLLDTCIEILEERYGKAEAWDELERIATEDSTLARWLGIVRKDRADSLAERNAPRTKRSADSLTYNDVKDRIAAKGRKYSVSLRWYKNATQPEKEQAAQDLLLQTDPDLMIGYLRLFKMSGFPLDPSPLIAWTAHEDAELVHWTLMTLGKTKHPRVRALALDCLAAGRHLEYLVGMLATNYEAGDSATVAKLTESSFDTSNYHYMEVGAKHFVKAHWDENSVPILLNLYENGPCSFCRETCVKLLLEHDALPEQIRDEARYDADEEVRALVTENGGVSGR